MHFGAPTVSCFARQTFFLYAQGVSPGLLPGGTLQSGLFILPAATIVLLNLDVASRPTLFFSRFRVLCFAVRMRSFLSLRATVVQDFAIFRFLQSRQSNFGCELMHCSLAV